MRNLAQARLIFTGRDSASRSPTGLCCETLTRTTTCVVQPILNVSFEGADLRIAVFEGATQEIIDLSPALLCNTELPNDLMDDSDFN